jgi:hypothetical protein
MDEGCPRISLKRLIVIVWHVTLKPLFMFRRMVAALVLRSDTGAAPPNSALRTSFGSSIRRSLARRLSDVSGSVSRAAVALNAAVARGA